MRINSRLLEKGLTYDRVVKAAEKQGLSLNDFIGACLLEFLEPKEGYNTLLRKLLKFSNPEVDHELESRFLEKVRMREKKHYEVLEDRD